MAAQGDARAQNAIGAMYLNGQGVKQDYAEALKQFKFAAEKGNVNAQYNLGIMYAQGQHVAQNDAEAAAWFGLAAGQGHIKASTILERCTTPAAA